MSWSKLLLPAACILASCLPAASASCLTSACRAESHVTSKGIALLQTASNLGRTGLLSDANSTDIQEESQRELASHSDAEISSTSSSALPRRLKAVIIGPVGGMAGAICSGFAANLLRQLSRNVLKYKGMPFGENWGDLTWGAGGIGAITGFGNAVKDCDNFPCAIGVGCTLGMGADALKTRQRSLALEVDNVLNNSTESNAPKTALRCAAGTVGGSVVTSVAAQILTYLVTKTDTRRTIVGISAAMGAAWGFALGFFADSVSNAFFDGFTLGLHRLWQMFSGAPSKSSKPIPKWYIEQEQHGSK